MTTGFKNKNANIAPKGSAIPEIKVYIKDFLLLPVDSYIGTEIVIPSGILCKAIANVIAIPKVRLVDADKKVAIPSGCV